MFFINKSSRYFLILVQSGATLAHRAMQRGPCKSRVTVTSAHAVLFQYNDIELHNNYFTNFCRVHYPLLLGSKQRILNFIGEEQSLPNNVKCYLLLLITQYWDLLIDALWNEHKQLTASTTYFFFSEIKNMTQSLKDGRQLSSGISR